MPEPKEQVVSAIIRARSELEDALYELEKIPAASQNSVSFAAHSLNNFLSVTGGAVELLSAKLAEYPDPKVQTLLQSLHHATHMMTHTVSQLLGDSTAKDFELHFEEVDLSIMLPRICYFYQRIADQKQIHILYESDADLLPVWADRVAVAAVLDNLFSNAVKFSPPGTSIRVKTSSERDGVACRVACSICDQGPGLSRKDQAKLFQRGVRLAPQPTGGEPSTGYGLAVAKEFIDQLGGAIWCESELGRGACFSIRLPCYQEKERERGKIGPRPKRP
ncbi:MAG: HAMP domain-containing sensor histidine kinase [Deltaproteobacteria bacterium]|jgi:signal transduction histidine kinase